jgi:hypothetical protein
MRLAMRFFLVIAILSGTAHTTIKHRTCVIRSHDLDYFNDRIWPYYIQALPETAMYGEGGKLIKEIENSLKNSSLNHLLEQKLLKKGYKLSYYDKSHMDNIINTLGNKLVNPTKKDAKKKTELEKTHSKMEGAKRGELHLNFNWNFRYKVQRVHNIREFSWKLTLIEHMRTRHKELPVILSSGFDEESMFKFTPDNLRDLFKKVLEDLPECEISEDI